MKLYVYECPECGNYYSSPVKLEYGMVCWSKEHSYKRCDFISIIDVEVQKPYSFYIKDGYNSSRTTLAKTTDLTEAVKWITWMKKLYDPGYLQIKATIESDEGMEIFTVAEYTKEKGLVGTHELFLTTINEGKE